MTESMLALDRPFRQTYPDRTDAEHRGNVALLPKHVCCPVAHAAATVAVPHCDRQPAAVIVLVGQAMQAANWTIHPNRSRSQLAIRYDCVAAVRCWNFRCHSLSYCSRSYYCCCCYCFRCQRPREGQSEAEPVTVLAFVSVKLANV